MRRSGKLIKTHKSVGLTRHRERIMIVASYGTPDVYETCMYSNENERVQTLRERIGGGKSS